MTTVRTTGALVLLAALGACSSTTTGTGTPTPSQDAGVDVPAPVDTGVDVPAVPDLPTVTDVPVPVSGIGTACMADGPAFPPQQGDCGDGQLCLTPAIGFPDGYCTLVCGRGGTRCPSDSVCGSLMGYPVCLLRCASNTDCRTGYICSPTDGSTRSVCHLNDAPVGARPDNTACYTVGTGSHQLPALLRTTFATANVLASDRTDSMINAEGNVAINPMNGHVANTYIGVSNRSVFMGVSHSADGASWTADGTVTDPTLPSTSDPVLDWGPDGVLRMTFIGLQQGGGGGGTTSHVRITESMDDGHTWSVPRQVDPAGMCTTGICDKPWITSGPNPMTPGGRSIYVTFAPQVSNGLSVVVARSDDNGMTWSRPVTLGTTGAIGLAYVSSNLLATAVSATGTFGGAWIGLSGSATSTTQGRFGSTDNRVLFRRSADGVRTLDTTRIVSRSTDGPVYTQPAIAWDGATVHVAYQSGTPDGAWDIILATSPDGGATWVYRKVNDEPDTCATHAFPAIVVDPMTHNVLAIWLDARFGAQHGAVAFARCPADPAMPCGTNEAVDDTAPTGFRFTTSRQPDVWHGDYLGLAVNAAGDLWATWSDTRSGTPQMYVAHGRAH